MESKSRSKTGKRGAKPKEGSRKKKRSLEGDSWAEFVRLRKKPEDSPDPDLVSKVRAELKRARERMKQFYPLSSKLKMEVCPGLSEYASASSRAETASLLAFTEQALNSACLISSRSPKLTRDMDKTVARLYTIPEAVAAALEARIETGLWPKSLMGSYVPECSDTPERPEAQLLQAFANLKRFKKKLKYKTRPEVVLLAATLDCNRNGFAGQVLGAFGKPSKTMEEFFQRFPPPKTTKRGIQGPESRSSSGDLSEYLCSLSQDFLVPGQTKFLDPDYLLLEEVLDFTALWSCKRTLTLSPKKKYSDWMDQQDRYLTLLEICSNRMHEQDEMQAWDYGALALGQKFLKPCLDNPEMALTDLQEASDLIRVLLSDPEAPDHLCAKIAAAAAALGTSLIHAAQIHTRDLFEHVVRVARFSEKDNLLSKASGMLEGLFGQEHKVLIAELARMILICNLVLREKHGDSLLTRGVFAHLPDAVPVLIHRNFDLVRGPETEKWFGALDRFGPRAFGTCRPDQFCRLFSKLEAVCVDDLVPEEMPTWDFQTEYPAWKVEAMYSSLMAAIVVLDETKRLSRSRDFLEATEAWIGLTELSIRIRGDNWESRRFAEFLCELFSQGPRKEAGDPIRIRFESLLSCEGFRSSLFDSLVKFQDLDYTQCCWYLARNIPGVSLFWVGQVTDETRLVDLDIEAWSEYCLALSLQTSVRCTGSNSGKFPPNFCGFPLPEGKFQMIPARDSRLAELFTGQDRAGLNKYRRRRKLALKVDLKSMRTTDPRWSQQFDHPLITQTQDELVTGFGHLQFLALSLDKTLKASRSVVFARLIGSANPRTPLNPETLNLVALKAFQDGSEQEALYFERILSMLLVTRAVSCSDLPALRKTMDSLFVLVLVKACSSWNNQAPGSWLPSEVLECWLQTNRTCRMALAYHEFKGIRKDPVAKKLLESHYLKHGNRIPSSSEGGCYLFFEDGSSLWEALTLCPVKACKAAHDCYKRPLEFLFPVLAFVNPEALVPESRARAEVAARFLEDTLNPELNCLVEILEGLVKPMASALYLDLTRTDGLPPLLAPLIWKFLLNCILRAQKEPVPVDLEDRSADLGKILHLMPFGPEERVSFGPGILEEVDSLILKLVAGITDLMASGRLLASFRILNFLNDCFEAHPGWALCLEQEVSVPQDWNCPYCLEPLDSNPALFKSGSCAHIYHVSCACRAMGKARKLRAEFYEKVNVKEHLWATCSYVQEMHWNFLSIFENQESMNSCPLCKAPKALDQGYSWKVAQDQTMILTPYPRDARARGSALCRNTEYINP